MNVEKELSIPFRGLKPGVYTYDFKVDDTLFEAYECTEIKHGAYDVRVELRRLETMLDMEIALDGKVVVACDRCLEDCELPIAYEGNLVVKFSDTPAEYDGEVMWLTPADDEVHLAQYIYESVILSLPYQRVHPEGECDPEMLNRFTVVTERELEQLEAEAEAHEEPSTLSPEAQEALAALKAQMERE